MNKFQENKQLIYFFAKAGVLFLAWYFIYEQWLFKVGWLDKVIIDNLVFLSEKILTFFGSIVYVYQHDIGLDGGHGVHIGAPCNGIDLMALFAGFIILFNGKWKDKLWFIGVGIIIIHFLNLLRVIALIIIAKHAPEQLDFNHKYTFTILLYVCIFLGWVIWVNNYSRKKA